MFDRRTAIVGAGAATLLAASPSWARSGHHLVEMLTDDPASPGQRMVFSPRVLRIRPGEQVIFRPTNPSHNCQSTPGMIPANASPWRGEIGKEVSVVLSEPGYYGYHCMPHRGLGMVGLVIVGDPQGGANLAAAQGVRQLGKAKEAWEEIWAEAL